MRAPSGRARNLCFSAPSDHSGTLTPYGIRAAAGRVASTGSTQPVIESTIAGGAPVAGGARQVELDGLWSSPNGDEPPSLPPAPAAPSEPPEPPVPPSSMP